MQLPTGLTPENPESSSGTTSVDIAKGLLMDTLLLKKKLKSLDIWRLSSCFIDESSVLEYGVFVADFDPHRYIKHASNMNFVDGIVCRKCLKFYKKNLRTRKN